jgi:hypothetical protein
VTGLEAGTTYCFKVAAKNAFLTSSFTSPLSMLTLPNPPTALTIATDLT